MTRILFMNTSRKAFSVSRTSADETAKIKTVLSITSRCGVKLLSLTRDEAANLLYYDSDRISKYCDIWSGKSQLFPGRNHSASTFD